MIKQFKKLFTKKTKEPEYTCWLRCYVCKYCEWTAESYPDICRACGGEKIIKAVGRHIKGDYFPGPFFGTKDRWILKKGPKGDLPTDDDPGQEIRIK